MDGMITKCMSIANVDLRFKHISLMYEMRCNVKHKCLAKLNDLDALVDARNVTNMETNDHLIP